MRTISWIPFLLIYCYAQLQTSWYRHAWCSYSTWRQSRYLQHWKYLNSVFAYSMVNVRVYRANGWSAVEDRHGHNTLHVFFPIPYNSVADQVGYLTLWAFSLFQQGSDTNSVSWVQGAVLTDAGATSQLIRHSLFQNASIGYSEVPTSASKMILVRAYIFLLYTW